MEDQIPTGENVLTMSIVFRSKIKISKHVKHKFLGSFFKNKKKKMLRYKVKLSSYVIVQ